MFCGGSEFPNDRCGNGLTGGLECHPAITGVQGEWLAMMTPALIAVPLIHYAGRICRHPARQVGVAGGGAVERRAAVVRVDADGSRDGS